MVPQNKEFPGFKHNEVELPKLERYENAYGERFYENESGKKYISVTSVLNAWPKPWLEKWEESIGKDKAEEIRQDALAFGTGTHAAAEDILNNKAPSYLYHDHFLAARSLISQIINSVSLGEILGVEKSVFSDKIDVAGTIDLVAYADNLSKPELTVFDFKTTKRDPQIREDHLLQSSAYAKLFEESSGMPVKKIGIVQVSRNNFNTIITIKDPDYYYEIFLERLNYYKKVKM